MKIRQDYVTNSSSSSFILGFGSYDEIDNVFDELPYYWADLPKQDVIDDIKNGIVTKEEAIEEYRQGLWMTNVKFHGKDYWDLSIEEIRSDEYKNFIECEKDKLCKKLFDELADKEVISVVTYSDHSLIGSELEHNIIPVLNNTIKRISHH